MLEYLVMFLFSCIKKYSVVVIISIILFILPFFWLQPGEVNLGGDSSRLYFLDPIAFIKNYSGIYTIWHDGTTVIEPSYYFLPFVGLLAIIKYFIPSTYVLISIFSGIMLSLGFLFTYLTVKQLLEEKNNFVLVQIASIIAGIFYIVASGSEKLIFYWNKPIMSHQQIFLNPLMFYLLLRFFTTKRSFFLWIALLISFVFAPNFSFTSAPPFFAFYPLAITFIMLYTLVIKKQSLPWKTMILGGVLYIGIQAFHLLPQIISIFDPGSYSHTSAFDKGKAVEYFNAVRGLGSPAQSMLMVSANEQFMWLAIIPAFLILCGFLLYKNKSKMFLFTAIFFLIIFYLASANITGLGIELYRKFFYIPGFSMFRNFYSQWYFIYIFFYALLLGQAFLIIAQKIKRKYLIILTTIVSIAFFVQSWKFLNGELVNRTQWGLKDVTSHMIIDKRYFVDTLQFIRTLPDDGKILMFPLSDNFNQVVFGVNNAAYVGPSTISYLTEKNSMDGYQLLYPYSEDIMRLSKEKKYKELLNIFSLFNIRYIFHNADPKIYEEKFLPHFPYTYMLTAMPKTQKEYTDFINHFPVQLIYKNGPYHIYELNAYHKEIYTTQSVEKETTSTFLDKKTCQTLKPFFDICTNKKDANISLQIKKINPITYNIFVSQQNKNDPYMLVFSNKFHSGWQLAVVGEKEIKKEQHIQVNGYANGWLVMPSDHPGKQQYTMQITLPVQKYFYYGAIISIISLISVIAAAGIAYVKKN